MIAHEQFIPSEYIIGTSKGPIVYRFDWVMVGEDEKFVPAQDVYVEARKVAKDIEDICNTLMRELTDLQFKDKEVASKRRKLKKLNKQKLAAQFKMAQAWQALKEIVYG